jgi:hypothetical protein
VSKALPFGEHAQWWSYLLVNEGDEGVAKAFEILFGTIASGIAQ